MPIISGIASCIRPSFLEQEAGDALTTRVGAKDFLLETVLTGLDWIPFFNFSETTQLFSKQASRDLEPMKLGLAVPGFFYSLNAFRREYQNLKYSDDPDIHGKLFNHAMVTVNAGSESAMFLDAIHLVELKEGLKAAKGLFWGSALLLDGVDFFRQIDHAKEYQKLKTKTKDPDVKSIYEHRIRLSYLKIVQAITTIAMASITLVAILFASLAQGILFSPIVFLCLATNWVVLNLVNYFYEKVIENQVKMLPFGMV